MSQTVKFSKRVYNQTQRENTIDTNITQLSQPQQETFFDVNLATIEDFFIIYQNLYSLIPQYGEINSHEYLVKESSKIITLDQQNDTVQSLLDEITELRQQNLDLQQEKVDLISQFSINTNSDTTTI